MIEKLDWKNSPDLYNDYVHLSECPEDMKRILLKYGWFFDDEYFYWMPKHRKTSRDTNDIVKRRPLVLYPSKSTPAEKVRIK